jgi:hypothetical protein
MLFASGLLVLIAIDYGFARRPAAAMRSAALNAATAPTTTALAAVINRPSLVPSPAARIEASALPVPKNVTPSRRDMNLDPNATTLEFTMATLREGPVVLTINVEKLDQYSYRLFHPRLAAPLAAKIVAKELLFRVNDSLRPDGSFSLLDMSIDGAGPTRPVDLDTKTTLILLMDQGPGADRIAPSFRTFGVEAAGRN